MVFNHNPRATITTTLNNENTLTFNDELLTFGQYRAPGLSVFFDGGSFGFCGVRGLSFGGLVLGFVLVFWCFVAVFVVCRVPCAGHVCSTAAHSSFPLLILPLPSSSLRSLGVLKVWLTSWLTGWLMKFARVSRQGFSQ
jgi:hypothetical protein